MPTYEYKCENGHLFETVQSMAADQLTKCEVCGAPVQRVFSPIAIHFKGSGFYTTDYGSKKKSASKDGDSSESKGEKSSSDKKEPAKAKSDSGGSGSGDSSSSSGD